MLFTCERAREVWEKLGLRPTIDEAAAHERAGLIILEKLFCSDLAGEAQIPITNGVELFMVATWYLCWNHRKTSHDKKYGSPIRTAMSI